MMIIADLSAQKEELELRIESNRHKVEYYEDIIDLEDLIEMSAVAKILNFNGMGRNKLFRYLREKCLLRFNNEPYQRYVDMGLFEIKPEKFENPTNGETMVYNKTHATQKGIDYIRRMLIEDGYERHENSER